MRPMTFLEAIGRFISMKCKSSAHVVLLKVSSLAEAASTHALTGAAEVELLVRLWWMLLRQVPALGGALCDISTFP